MKNMDIKVKTALILIVTLLIGIVFGAMLYRAMFQSKVKGFLEMRTPDGFIRKFENAVDTTPDKKEKIKKILDKYGEQFFEMNQEHRKEVSLLFNSLREELAEILTPEQIRKMLRRGFLRPGRFSGRPEGRGFPDRFKGPPDPGKRRHLQGLKEQREGRNSRPRSKEKSPKDRDDE